jgi:hypothetical protein
VHSGPSWDLGLGNWDFRDNYVGSGSPDNISAVATAGFRPRCFRYAKDQAFSFTYQGKDRSDLTYRYDVGRGSGIYRVRDRTRNHMMLTDNGFHWHDYRRVGRGCKGRPRGKFYFEHSQGGSGGWSASVGIGGLNVSYSGSSGMTLRKSSNLRYLR